MKHAAIVGWGKCMPPNVLTNADLSTFLDTDDEWIVSRTGMRQRRISHVSGIELAAVASMRALACAGLDAKDLDLIILGSTSFDEQVPNCASGVQFRIGAVNAGAMDLNTACTSFLYGVSSAAGMIASGAIRNALVIGVEVISQYMDWSDRNVAVLFGDGCGAVVLQATEREEGLLAAKLGCIGDQRQSLRARGVGGLYTNKGIDLGQTAWDFDGREIFRHAVAAMVDASGAALARAGYTAADVDLLVPHQANLRIIDGVSKRCGIPDEKVMLTIERYGNMSAATVPVALAEALEQGRVRPGALLLMPAFGGGLTYCSHLVRWGERTQPLATSTVELPAPTQSALEIINGARALKAANKQRSAELMRQVTFCEAAGRIAT
jgi:3-oxoacyl-[acyl-carrier-protein] synthase-3